MNTKKIPTKEAIAEALKHPNGWVYEIEETYRDKEDVPPEAIKGAWKVNDKGIIVGEFMPNLKFVDREKK